MRAPWKTIASLAALFVAFVATRWLNHVDTSDPQLYAVVVRNMIRDQSWVSMRYVVPFYEHLPFGFWPMVVWVRCFGEPSLALFSALLCGASLVVTGLMVNALAGRVAAFAATLLLICTESFTIELSTSRIDTVMLPLALLAAALVLTRALTWRWWLVVLVTATAAACVKGPFGVVPLVASVVARAWVERSPRIIALGALVTLAALAVPMAFVLTHDDWYQGYFLNSVVGKATGTRLDGKSEWWYALHFISRRCWPPLALVPFALVLTLRSRARDHVLLGSVVLVILVLLSLPTRKSWHHTLVAYPFIAAWGAVAVARFIERFERWFAPVSAASAVVLTALNVSGVAGRVLFKPPCVVSTELRPLALGLRSEEVMKVAAPTTDWHLMSALAYEYDAVPIGVSELDGPPQVRVIIAREELANAPGWLEKGRARGWVWLERAP